MTKRESFVSIMGDNLIKHCQLTAKLAGHRSPSRIKDKENYIRDHHKVLLKQNKKKICKLTI